MIETKALNISVRGIVQGVGFRPHVFALARECEIRGWVVNSKGGVEIRAEGSAQDLEAFVAAITHRAPRMAYITEILRREEVPRGYRDFTIRPSDAGGPRQLLISPDVSTCSDCRREIDDSSDRHFRYPFTNCTHCGPRFTIIDALPYDRPRTSMAPFTMCPDCAAEYGNPRDRRFHAQPVACPVCGPQVCLLGPNGTARASGEDAMSRAMEELASGAVVAVRGMGGFHLACDARSTGAVARVRAGKARPHRPLAVMARDVEIAAGIVRLRPAERDALESPEAPIVIARRRVSPEIDLAPNLAPEMTSLGVMLPYTPLHILLLSGEVPVLVMTSGNRRGLPLVTDTPGALQELAGIADLFLTHDREILRRVDDSVLRFDESPRPRPIPYRRSRGYVPRPLSFRGPPGPTVLGVGGQEKNTFCLLEEDYAFLGAHQGDLEYEEARRGYREAVADLSRLLEIEPRVVACDRHPDYFTTEFAREFAADRGATLVPVQHHHAHLASCLAESGRNGPALGIIADGTGYGEDGTLRGMEILHGDLRAYSRLVSLAPVRLPGADRAIRRPMRAALAHLHRFLGPEAGEEFTAHHPKWRRELEIARAQLQGQINAPQASGCGRLFDAVSAYLGICREASYGGQPAAELSELAGWGDHPLPFDLVEDGEGLLRWDLARFWEALRRRAARDFDPKRLASDFQRTVGEMFLAGARRARESTSCAVVALSGGVFQNPTLLAGLVQLLESDGFEVLVPREVPPNDGGISLGQAAVGRMYAADHY